MRNLIVRILTFIVNKLDKRLSLQKGQEGYLGNSKDEIYILVGDNKWIPKGSSGIWSVGLDCNLKLSLLDGEPFVKGSLFHGAVGTQMYLINKDRASDE